MLAAIAEDASPTRLLTSEVRFCAEEDVASERTADAKVIFILYDGVDGSFDGAGCPDVLFGVVRESR